MEEKRDFKKKKKNETANKKKKNETANKKRRIRLKIKNLSAMKLAEQVGLFKSVLGSVGRVRRGVGLQF